MRKLIFMLLLIPVMSFGQDVTKENVITVVGVADKEIEPEWIQLGMSARETENTKKESEIIVMENSILKFILSLGLDSNSFSINRYSANTKYSYSGSSKYKLNKAYKLKIDKVNLMDTIIAKCFDLGMDNINVDQVGHSKIDSLQNIVLREALISAKEKAELIATTMGVNLGKVVLVHESFWDNNHQTVNYQEESYQSFALMYSRSESRAVSSLSFQKIKINKAVVVKYGIQ